MADAIESKLVDEFAGGWFVRRHIQPMIVGLLVTACGLSAAESAEIDFAREVWPILSEHCLKCHGRDEPQADLRLTGRDGLLHAGTGGRPIVAPHRPDESELIRRITSQDPSERMPPEGTKPLTSGQIETLTRWIAAGAPWAEHWAFQPITRPPVPMVTRTTWPRTELDHYVLAELERHGWTPSPEAERTTLIKRLSYDLLGLPPSLEEVDAFLADERPTAYADLVERLLASPHFGERWGRHWLDQAHYADSDGYEKDRPRPDAFHYRDWVITSLNRDQPFDEFTIEQLAGDLLPHATAAQHVATAFLRQTLTNEEGGVDQEEFRVNACFDRTETVGTVWLGLTIGCARCHGHKYDPIPHDDYYRLFAYFNDADETTLRLPLEGERAVALDQALQPLREALAARYRVLAPALAAWETAERDALPPLSADSNLHEEPLTPRSVTSTTQPTATFTIQDGVIEAPPPTSDGDRYVIDLEVSGPLTGFKLTALTDTRAPKGGSGWSEEGVFVINHLTASLVQGDDLVPIPLHRATADSSAPRSSPAAVLTVTPPERGWRPADKVDAEHWLQVRTMTPLEVPPGATLRIVIDQTAGGRQMLARFRITALRGNPRGLHLPSPAVVAALDMYPEKRVAATKQLLRNAFVEDVLRDPVVRDLKTKIAAAERRLPAGMAEIRTITAALHPRVTRVFHRGEFLSPTHEVSPGGLSALAGVRAAPTASTRLDLARWLVAPEQPLTARVAVNQVWLHLFGQGLVRTPNDFGVRGERPTHPALLDALASRFRDDWMWSRKELIRQIVLSASYRQASWHRPDYEAIDPTNTRLFRQNRFRVEAEIIRDLGLAAAGLLDRTIGGPSVYPPMPEDLAKLSYANNFSWTASTGRERYRRGMYTFFKRTIPHPNLMTFDAPDANVACVMRSVSNTPLQSLLLLNNEAHHEAARALARRVLQEVPDEDGARIERLFRLCVARPPESDERAELLSLLITGRAKYESDPAATRALLGLPPEAASVPEDAAWTLVARVVLNLDEFLTRE